jgi:hypothetical protein
MRSRDGVGRIGIYLTCIPCGNSDMEIIGLGTADATVQCASLLCGEKFGLLRDVEKFLRDNNGSSIHAGKAYLRLATPGK